LLAAKQRAQALLGQAAKLGQDDNDQLESEARAAGVSPDEVPDALRWLSQVAAKNPQWLVKAIRRLDPSAAPSYSLLNLFAVYRQRGSLR
jgi:uncharacterized protein Smg (DUF494 family)